MAEQITIEGLKKERVVLRKAFDSARDSYDKSRVVYEKAKVLIVDFENSYGRVLELLEQPKKV